MTEDHEQVRGFPADWPGNCPPADAEDADGTIYRVVKENPLKLSDFLNHWERGLLPGAEPCLRHGLSVFEEIEGAVHMRRLFPKLGGYVAEGTLVADHGKCKVTEGKHPSHMTWWPYEGIDRTEMFEIVKDLQ